ncbi:MAG TPA: serine/threonine-protein kinase, partial [Planctomycetaceae bacterium]|nr:serine/threonine-protein kinase [Planctomycetaceae bacterium]
EGRQYFSMDFVAGKNLAELVRTNPLPAERAASYVKTIAEAVHFAHQRGTLHRDLKPQNVLIDADDRPRITDFGLAKRVETESSLTRTGDVLGSPSYMPPEQAESRSDRVGPQSDVYSLGAILYELLTGRPPFRGATTWETICQVLQTPPVSPRRLNPNVPQDLETICLKCLEKQPERRYHSARELAEELDRFLNHEPIHARPISLVRRSEFWARRHPWAIASVTSFLVIGLAFVSYGLWAQNRFLVWLQTHPDYVRAPGPWTERLEVVDDIGSLLWVVIGFAFALTVMRRAKFDRARRAGKLGSPGLPLNTSAHPPSRRWMLTVGILSGVGIVYGFFVLGMLAETFVWEGWRKFSDVGTTYLLFWVSITALMDVVRNARLRAYGSNDRPVSPQDEKAIREAIAVGDFIAAIRLHRRASGASLPDAYDYVHRIAREYEAKHPGEIAARARLLYGVRPKRLIVGMVIEVAILAAILFFLATPERARWALEFIASGFAGFVLASINKRASKNRWFAIGLVVSPVIISAELSSRFWSPQHYVFGAFFAGLFAGIFLFRVAYAKFPTVQPANSRESRPTSPD